MANVITGAIAIVKSNGKIISKLKSWSFNENIQRGEVVGIGTIYASEAPVLKYSATLSCAAMTVGYKDGIIPNAFKRNISKIQSQVLTGNVSVEDNLTLEDQGVTIECYLKIKDVIDAQGNIVPKVAPLITVPKCFLEGSSLEISESAISGTNQNFKVLEPPVY